MEVLSKHIHNSSLDAIGLLASHSLELALKSFLITKGWSEKNLAEKLKHDLNTAWTEAVNSGLAITTQPPFWLQILALGHGYPYIFRYPLNNTAIAIPELGELAPGARRIIEIIQTVHQSG